ncbi:DUF3857 domain-containing protein [Winogradskyella sp. A2]|uniref:DUF3857 domain-containing protein n=1 Tax=Winogradskyella sp. A2 TaxID=3366944 RepID=UPI00398C31B3
MPYRKYYLILLGVLFSISSSAQSESDYKSLLIPLELKESANAVVRYEKKTIDIIDFDEIIVSEKRVVTVFNERGNRHSGAVQYYDDNTEIKKMEAQIFNANGERIKRIKKNDFTDASAVSEISIYEDDRIKFFDYNPLKYPYTIEYTVEVVYKNTAFFPNWRPVDNYYLSIQHSEYEISNTIGVELKTKKENFEEFNIEALSKHHFLAKDIKGIKYEAFAPDFGDIVPHYKVALKEFNMLGVEGVNNDWKDFGKWMYDKLLTGTDQIPQSTIDEVKLLTAGIENKIERAKLVYEFMQDKTRYISIQVGIGGWKPMLANDVDRLGYSDCKGLTNYTKALLEAVEVPSYYTVVYGGNNIKNIDKDFSHIEGNHVILCVPSEDKNIFLECTSQTNPFGFTAGFTDDRDVLLVKPNGGEIVHTKVYSAEESLQTTDAKVVLNEEGGFSAEVKITSTGYQYNSHEGVQNESDRDKDLHYKEYWDNINNLSIDDIELNNDKDKIVFEEKVKLSTVSYASKSGTRLILEPNMFNKITSIPQRYISRSQDFKVDRAIKDVDEYIIEFPKGLKIEAMAKNGKVSTSFGRYHFNIKLLEDNKLKYTREFITNKGEFDKTDYEAFRDFLKKVVKYDKTKIVLVKA